MVAVVGGVGVVANPAVELVSVVAHEDAPAPAEHASENDRGCLGSGHRSLLLEHLVDGDHELRHLGGGFDRSVAQGVGDDLCADVAGHDDVSRDVWGVHLQIGDQGFGEALHGELRRRVGGVGTVGSDGCVEAVDARRVDHCALGCGGDEWQEDAAAEVDAAPDDIEGPFPRRPLGLEHGATTGDAGVVEQQMDVVGVEAVDDGVTERLEICFLRHVGHVGEYPHVGCLLGDHRRGLGHRVGGEVAEGDVAAAGRKLSHELAAHAGAAAGDDRNLA